MFENKDAAMLNRMAEIGTKVDGVGVSVKQVKDNVSKVATKTDIQSATQSITHNMKYNPKEYMNYHQYPFFNLNAIGATFRYINCVAVAGEYVYICVDNGLYIYNKSDAQFVTSITTQTNDFRNGCYGDNNDYIWFWYRGVVVVSKTDFTIKYQSSTFGDEITNAIIVNNNIYLLTRNNNAHYCIKINIDTGKQIGSIEVKNYNGSTKLRYRSLIQENNLIIFPVDANGGNGAVYNIETMTEDDMKIPTIYTCGCFYTNDCKLVIADERNIHIYNADFQYQSSICISHGKVDTFSIQYIYRDATYMYCVTTDILFVYKLVDLSLVGYYHLTNLNNIYYIACDGVNVYVYCTQLNKPIVYTDLLIVTE